MSGPATRDLSDGQNESSSFTKGITSVATSGCRLPMGFAIRAVRSNYSAGVSLGIRRSTLSWDTDRRSGVYSLPHGNC
jgi:hypothetical protein